MNDIYNFSELGRISSPLEELVKDCNELPARDLNKPIEFLRAGIESLSADIINDKQEGLHRDNKVLGESGNKYPKPEGNDVARFADVHGEKIETEFPLGSKENPFRLPRCINQELEGNGLYEKKTIKIWGRYVEGVFPHFEGPKVTLKEGIMDYVEKFDTGRKFYLGTMEEASKTLWGQIKDNPNAQKEYTSEQLEALKEGKARIPGKIWHHYEEMDGDRPVMQLVDEKVHKENKHTGGSYTWNEKHYIECYGTKWRS